MSVTRVAIESKLHLYLYQHSVNSLYFLYLDEETRKSAATPLCLNEVVFPYGQTGEIAFQMFGWFLHRVVNVDQLPGIAAIPSLPLNQG